MTRQTFPDTEAFRSADPVRLRALYDSVFARIQEKERAYRVFASVPPQIPRVLDEVTATIAAFSHEKNRPPLYGVPVGIKAIFRTAGYPIRCGSLLPADLFDGPEAAIVVALRKLGAVIVGNTATAEFACAEPAATCNPHNMGHTPGGSSSGSAAGVAAGFFPVGVGTQTVGSIIRPAAYCGVTGFKPSYGLVSASGMIYFSRSVDHVGFFTATPAEMMGLFRALFPDRPAGTAPKTIRLGVPVGPYLDQALPDTLARFENHLAAFAAKGLSLEVIPIPCFREIEALAECHKALIAAEFWEEHGDKYQRYEALFRPRTVEMLLYGKEVGRAAIERGKTSLETTRALVHAAMREHGLTAWACPAAVGEAEKGLTTTGNACMNMPWTHAGLPSLTIPAGVGPQGLPLGLQLVGAFGEDETLLAVGEALYAAGKR